MESNYKYILGRNIKAERVRKSITQERLAELTDMSLSYISKLEQGLISPTAVVLFKISKILHIAMEEFFKGVEI